MNEIQPPAMVSHSIDDRARTEQGLYLSRNQLAIILDGIADGVTAQNPNGQLIYANDAAARINGYPSVQALLTAPLTEILRKFELFDELEQPMRVEELPSRLALQGIQSPPKVIRFRVVATGEERWSLVRSQPVYGETGQVELVVNIFHDITHLKRAELGQRLLALAGTLLSASLDYETRLGHVAQLAVPAVADWCAIDVIGADGSLRRLAMIHVNPAKIELARELERRYPPATDEPTGIYEVLRTGQSQLYADISDSQLEAAIKDPEQLALVRQLGLKSAMIVPMVARGRTLGAISFAWAESGQRYGPIDLELAEELARRAALAMDNALLYAEAQSLNAELERRVAERTAQVIAVNSRLSKEIAERRQAEEQVRVLNAELEQRVAERTAQLEIVNRDLQNEITERQRASRARRAVLKRTRELYHISQTIGTVRTPQEVLEALRTSSYLEAASRASIAIFDAPWLDVDKLPRYCEILTAWNKDADLPAYTGKRFTLEEYGLLPPYSHDKPIMIEDIRSNLELPESVRRRFETLRTRSLIILPLIAGGAWYGVISFHFQSRRAVEVDDLRHLGGLVNEAAIAIDNIRLLAAEAKARREAEQANDVKMNFLAMISHELRTPLTSIKGFSTTLLADDVQWHPESQRDFLLTISEEADKLGDLIEQLLDLSRLEAGVLRIVPKTQSLDNIIATAMVQLQTVSQHHQLVLDLPRDPPLVIVDAQRIAQVLTNLVGNAVKYSPPQTIIRITAQQEDDLLQINITDRGPGIPREERTRIFEPFQQLGDRPINRSEGAGLGLAICKGLVEAHGGRIWVQDGTGPGTTISFTVPIDMTAKMGGAN